MNPHYLHNDISATFIASPPQFHVLNYAQKCPISATNSQYRASNLYNSAIQIPELSLVEPLSP